MKFADLRGILQYVPQFRGAVFVIAVDGEVVVDGWRTRTGKNIVEQMRALRPYVSGFLVTFVEREGRMQGTNMAQVAALVGTIRTGRPARSPTALA